MPGMSNPYSVSRMYHRRSSPSMMTTAWITIVGGILGMVLGYLIANHVNGFDPLEILPLTIGR